ncbi:MAG: electron transfer flavoprotein subunit alpha/FixB family protein [Deinococcales bacterium]|nr:electron transfer flavoprotein subunit alpha/FixB family protein [Deinococcales bacterium]
MILIVTAAVNGSLPKSALELVTVARELAGGAPVAAAVVGPEAAAAQLAGYVPQVRSLQAPELEPLRAEALTTAAQQVAAELGANTVVMSANRLGQSVAPRLAVRLGAALLEDVIAVSTDGGLRAKRYSYLARVTETVEVAGGGATVVTVKPNVFPLPEAQPGGSVAPFAPTFGAQDTRVTVGERSAAAGGRVKLEEAKAVVAGGRGLGSAEAFDQLVEPLADALGAGIAATRAVVDAGWRPYAEQVGQTGKSVAPDLYLALGISGAVQHLSGMNRSKVIVAVNKDADAPIFKIVDYGIVGDVAQVAPAIAAALEESQGS